MGIDSPIFFEKHIRQYPHCTPKKALLETYLSKRILSVLMALEELILASAGLFVVCSCLCHASICSTSGVLYDRGSYWKNLSDKKNILASSVFGIVPAASPWLGYLIPELHQYLH
jgi:hypothetical protein